MESVEIPNGVESIKGGSFYNCSSLKSINMPKTISNIKLESFHGGGGTYSYDLPSTTTINFTNGKNDNLTIPSDKWGAGSVLVNGVEYNP